MGRLLSIVFVTKTKGDEVENNRNRQNANAQHNHAADGVLYAADIPGSKSAFDGE